MTVFDHPIKMAGVITKRCILVADFPSSPHPPSGEVTIQGEIHPPARSDFKGDTVSEEHLADEDWIIYPRCLIFTEADKQDTMTRRSKHNMHNKQRRIGKVPKIFANFFGRSYQMNTNGNLDIRPMGLAFEGQHNGHDARMFPVSAGRLASMIHGAASGVFDNRFLRNPCFGDYLEVLYCDSGFRPGTGSELFGIPIVRNVSPSMIHFDQRSQSTFGGKAVIAGSRGPSLQNLQRTMVAYNVLSEVAKSTDTDNRIVDIETTAFTYFRVGAKMWDFKAWGMPVGAALANTPFDDGHDAAVKWAKAGFATTDAAQRNKMMKWFGVGDNGQFLQHENAERRNGMHLFQRRANGGGGNRSMFLLNPFLRLPVKAEAPALDQDAILYGSPDAPGFLYHAAKALRDDPTASFLVPEDSPIYLRVLSEWKATDGQGNEVDRNYNTGFGQGGGAAQFGEKTEAEALAIVNAFVAASGIANFAIGPGSAKEIGINGNPNTWAKIHEYEITGGIGPDKSAFCVALAGAIDAYIPTAANQAEADAFGRVSFGGGADHINKGLETFCQLCNGGGPQGFIKTGDDAGRLVFGSKWDQPDVFSGDQKAYLVGTFLKKFVGFPATIVMASINSEFSRYPFWVEHPAMRATYGFIDNSVNVQSMQLEQGGKTVDVPLQNYFGVQWRSVAVTMASPAWVDRWTPVVPGGGVRPTQTLARMGKFHLPADYDNEDIIEANKMTSAGFHLTDAVPTGSHLSIHPNELEDVERIEEVLEQVDRIQPDPRRFIGIFLEQTPGEHEARFLLRHSMAM